MVKLVPSSSHVQTLNTWYLPNVFVKWWENFLSEMSCHNPLLVVGPSGNKTVVLNITNCLLFWANISILIPFCRVSLFLFPWRTPCSPLDLVFLRETIKEPGSLTSGQPNDALEPVPRCSRTPFRCSPSSRIGNVLENVLGLSLGDLFVLSPRPGNK